MDNCNDTEADCVSLYHFVPKFSDSNLAIWLGNILIHGSSVVFPVLISPLQVSRDARESWRKLPPMGPFSWKRVLCHLIEACLWIPRMHKGLCSALRCHVLLDIFRYCWTVVLR